MPIIEIPGFGEIDFPDVMSQEEIDYRIRTEVLPNIQLPPQEDLPKSEFGLGAGAGMKSAQGNINYFFGDLAKQAGFTDTATMFKEIASKYQQEADARISAAKTPELGKIGTLEDFDNYFWFTLGNIIPSSAMGASAAALGAATPLGVAGAIGAGALATYPQFVAENLKAQEKSGERDALAAYATGVPQALSEVVLGPELGILRGVAGKAFKEMSLRKALTKGTIQSATQEPAEEVAQQAMQRAQAGQDLFSKEAAGEYAEGAAAGLIGGLAGGPIAGAAQYRRPREMPVPEMNVGAMTLPQANEVLAQWDIDPDARGLDEEQRIGMATRLQKRALDEIGRSSRESIDIGGRKVIVDPEKALATDLLKLRKSKAFRNAEPVEKAMMIGELENFHFPPHAQGTIYEQQLQSPDTNADEFIREHGIPPNEVSPQDRIAMQDALRQERPAPVRPFRGLLPPPSAAPVQGPISAEADADEVITRYGLDPLVYPSVQAKMNAANRIVANQQRRPLQHIDVPGTTKLHPPAAAPGLRPIEKQSQLYKEPGQHTTIGQRWTQPPSMAPGRTGLSREVLREYPELPNQQIASSPTPPNLGASQVAGYDNTGRPVTAAEFDTALRERFGQLYVPGENFPRQLLRNELRKILGGAATNAQLNSIIGQMRNENFLEETPAGLTPKVLPGEAYQLEDKVEEFPSYDGEEPKPALISPELRERNINPKQFAALEEIVKRVTGGKGKITDFYYDRVPVELSDKTMRGAGKDKYSDVAGLTRGTGIEVGFAGTPEIAVPTTYHEAYHVIRNIPGLLTSAEVNALARGTPRLRELLEELQRKGRFDPSFDIAAMIPEEVEAQVFGYFSNGRDQSFNRRLPGAIRRAYLKIAQFLREVGRVLEGREINAADVMERLYSGLVGSRSSTATPNEKTSAATTLSPELVKQFDALASKQRGTPETMFSAKYNPNVNHGTGIWTYLLEHGGDIIHRAAQTKMGQWGMHEAVPEKIRKLHSTMFHPYGVAKEIQDNTKSNWEYAKREHGYTGTLAKFTLDQQAAGERYAKAYETLEPLTKIQRLGKDFAIAVGRMDFETAKNRITELKRMLDAGEIQEQYYVREEIPEAALAGRLRTWFGNSKIVDENGNPKVMYHGTPHVFDKFGPRTGFPNAGHYFTSSARVASNYSGYKRAGEKTGLGDVINSNVRPVYLKVLNPKIIDSHTEYDMLASLTREDVAKLKAQGYDALMQLADSDNPHMGIRQGEVKEIVVFDNNQIRSIFESQEEPKPALISKARQSLKEVSAPRNMANDIGAVNALWHTPSRIAELFPAAKRVYQALLNRRMTRTKSMQKSLTDLRPIGVLGRDEKRRVTNAILEAWQTEKPVNTDGMNANEKAAVKAHVETMSAIWKDLGDAFVTFLRTQTPEDAKENIVVPEEEIARVRQEFLRAARISYMPAIRFGNIAVNMTRADGTRVVETYGKNLRDFSNKRVRQTANARRLQLLKENPGAKVEVHDFNRDEWRRMGLHELPFIEQIANSLGFEDDVEIKRVFRELKIEIAKKTFRGFLSKSKRVPGIVHEENIDWYLPRADVVYSARAASFIANMKHMNEMSAALKDLENLPGLAKYFKELNEYALSPQETGAWLKNFAFMYLIGGNVSSAAVNFTQLLHTTWPMLNAIGGKRAVSAMMKGFKDAVKMSSLTHFFEHGIDFTKNPGWDKAKWEAFQRTHDSGLLGMVQLKDITGQLDPMLLGDIAKFKATGDINRNITTFLEAMAGFFGYVEVINRITTWSATYDMAKNNPATLERASKFMETSRFSERSFTPEILANAVTEETQFITGKENRVKFMRQYGAFTEVPSQFMQFPIMMLELMGRYIGNAGQEGHSKALLMMAMGLWLTGGLLGMPFADFAKEIIEKSHRFLTGKGLDVDHEIRDFLRPLGDMRWAESLLRGPFRTVSGIDISKRTILDFPKVDWLTPDENIFGPIGGIVGGVGKANQWYQEGFYWNAAASLMPLAIRNPINAALLSEEGHRTVKGGILVPPDKVGLEDIVSKGLGFQPTTVSRAQEYFQYGQDLKHALDDRKAWYTNQLVAARVGAVYAGRAGDEARAKSLMEDYRHILQEIRNEDRKEKNPANRLNIKTATVMEHVKRDLAGMSSPEISRKMVQRDKRNQLLDDRSLYIPE